MNWKEEGVILDLKDVSWAKKNAWAPCIIEKKQADGNYKYYYYYTAEQQIGVAVADSPTGPFIDSGTPMIDKVRPGGMSKGQNIDPDVFTDPASGKTYLYWGNYYMAVCELNEDMVSIKPNTTRILIDMMLIIAKRFMYFTEMVTITSPGPKMIPAVRNIRYAMYVPSLRSILLMPPKAKLFYAKSLNRGSSAQDTILYCHFRIRMNGA